MAKILLLETATEVCSVALGVDGRATVLKERPSSTQHAALLTVYIDACMKEVGMKLSELDAVALSAGPGSYSALRVGASVAKGICYALDKPLIAVNTLESLAHACSAQYFSTQNSRKSKDSILFAPMLDARRSEVWLALYDGWLGMLAPAQPLILENNSFENFLEPFIQGKLVESVVLSGNGLEKARSGGFSNYAVYSIVEKSSAAYLAVLAEQKFQVADYQDVAYFEPFYMKPPNITVPNKSLL